MPSVPDNGPYGTKAGSSTSGNPFHGMGVYIGRKGLSDHLDLLLTDEAALMFLLNHPANHVWHVVLDNVTEMTTTDPVPPKLITRE